MVPVKAPRKSKSKLSRILNPLERSVFTLTMLEDVLNALKSAVVSQIYVISSGSTVQELTGDLEVAYISEKQSGLNQAIKQATERCIQNNAKSVLILPADIPLITCHDINRIVKMGSTQDSIVISQSGNGGTNALLQKPPNLISVSFGPHSFWKHVDKALTKRVSIKFYSSKRVTFDIDTPGDLGQFLKTKSQTRSHQFLEQIRLCDRLIPDFES